MEKDFEVGQSNEIVSRGVTYDLHNLYDFGQIVVSGGCRVQLSFVPNAQHGNEQRPVVIEFDGVDYLEFSTHFGSRPVSLVEEIGYKSPGDDDDAWLMSERQATATDHLFFRLGDGDFVRIHSRQAKLLDIRLGLH